MKQSTTNILILAYASEPKSGSEYGVGWNIPILLAQKYTQYNIYVLTRSRCKEKILETLLQIKIPNLHFLFYDLPQWMFYKNEMKSNWGEQINYLLWQLMVKSYIKKLHKKIHFDIIHHLTFNQYRTPSPGFFLNIPFIMGPIGGAETINPSFYQDLQPHTLKKELIRKTGKDLKIFGWWCKRKNNKKFFLFSTKENIERLSPYCNKNQSILLPAIAFDPNDFNTIQLNIQNNTRFLLVYAGKALDWKGIYIFLKAARKAYIENNINNFTIKLVGIRYKEEQNLVMQWVKELKLDNNVELIPFIQRSDLLKLLTECNLSVYPAFRDSGSMSVLEASALGCPTICFNAGGQDAFPDSVLLKVDVKNSYQDNLNSFAEKLKWAYDNIEQTADIGKRAKKYVYQELTWEKKVECINSIYQQALK